MMYLLSGEEALGRRQVVARASDMELVEATRAGDTKAFRELWDRHAAAVGAVTRAFTSLSSDDILQETFLRIWKQLEAGNGPQTAFRAYAIATARSIASSMGRRRTVDEITGVTDETLDAYAEPVGDEPERLFENEFTAAVFRSLPVRWQEVLWYRDVEGLAVREFSQYLGMNENATSALLKRAREGFKQAWIAANLDSGSVSSPECKWVVERLPQYSRGLASPNARRRVETHLETCDACSMMAGEAEQLHRRLAAVLLPTALGTYGALEYRSWLTSQQEPDLSGSPTSATIVRTRSQTMGRIAKVAVVPLALVSAGAIAVSVLTAMNDDVESASTGAAGPRSSASSSPSDSTPPEAPVTQHSTEEHADDASRAGNATNERPPTPAVAHVVVPPGRDDTSDPNATDTTSLTPDVTIPPPTPPVVAPPPPDDPVTVPTTLSASPLDGQEVGIYPNFVGTGVAGAKVTITVTNDAGQTLTATTTVGTDGVWKYTTSRLRGVLTVSASQTYQRDGVEYVETPTQLGTYKVGNGLTMRITATGANESTIRVAGFGPASKNQVLNLKSATHGNIVTRQPMTAPGEVVLVLPYSRASLDDTVFYAGDTSRGPGKRWLISAPAP